MSAGVVGEEGGPWWRGGAIYQIYLRSWCDSNGDGIGDLPGATARLDHLRWLGVEGVWLSPTMPSPNRDFGYDVSDYYGVQPDLGSEEDLAQFVARASEAGISVLLDLVANHTSEAHPWFVKARSDPSSPERDYYVWAPPRPGGGPPNNWVDATGGCAWSLDETSGQYYLHNFLPSQPDLNWWNPAVREELERVLRYWFDFGIAGFRIDVAHGLVKDAQLRDNPPAGQDAHPLIRQRGTLPVYNANRPEVHDIYRGWRRIADGYKPPRVLLGETWVLSPEELAPYYGDGSDELHLGLNFGFFFSPFEPRALAEVVGRTLAALPEGSCPLWCGSNHDASRLATRWAGGDERKVRLALGILCLLPGSVVLYYGDEIGMVDTDVPAELLRDEMTRQSPSHSRDRARTPMPWSAAPGGGFSEEGAARPWLPMGDNRANNVESQREDPSSVLHMCRELLSLRRGGLASRSYRPLALSDELWCWEAMPGTAVVCNFSDEPLLMAEGSAGQQPTVPEWRSWREPGAAPGGPRIEPWGLAVLPWDEARLVDALGGRPAAARKG